MAVSIDDPEKYRHQLAVLASSRHTRSVPAKSKLPCKWWPHRTLDPRTGSPFTDDSAWEFVVELLQAQHPIDLVQLRIPLGGTGFSMVYPLGIGRILYVKLQLGSGTVLGRSFHDSVHSEANDDS